MEGRRFPLILVLDTSALWHEPLVGALVKARARGLHERGVIDVVLPSIAYAERLRQLRRDGLSERAWRVQLEVAGVQVEPFTLAEAERLRVSIPDEVWARHNRDYLISRHVHGARIAVTDDAGPAWAGVRRLTPAAAAEAVRSLLEAG